MILDGTTSYLTVYPCISTSASEVIQRIHEWMDTYQVNPKSICGDMAFHSPMELQEFYRLHNIRPLPTGPHTPWPNRAETGVRLFKKFFHTLVEDVAKKQLDGILEEITASQLMRKAATIRNTQVTSSGKTPLELAFGRKPRDLLDPANMNLQQLTTAKNTQDVKNEELQKIAMKTHIEVQQREDIRRDLAANLKFIPADLVPGEKVYYWQEDHSKIKQGKKSGIWLQAVVQAVKGPMATINIGTGIMQVNATKLSRPYEKIDFDESTDSRERAEVPAYWHCQTNGSLDFLELFSASTRLSSACATIGMRTGKPMSLRKGGSFYSRKGRNEIKRVAATQKPRIIFMFPESAPWMWMKSKAKKENARYVTSPFASWCVEIANFQKRNNKYFILAHPEDSALWLSKPVRELEKKSTSTWTTLIASEFDPMGSSKRIWLLHNLPEGIFKPLNPKTSRVWTSAQKEYKVDMVQQRKSSHREVLPNNICSVVADCLSKMMGRELPEENRLHLLRVSLTFCIHHQKKKEDSQIILSIM